MSIFVTADLHLGHDREFIYKPRGFSSIQEHDETIIKNWNSVVKEDDIVYVLGDVMLGNNSSGLEKVLRLNGSKILIVGNHDTENRIELYKTSGAFLQVYDAKRIKHGAFHFFLTHYPMLTGSLEASSLAHMEINLYGHRHQRTNFYEDRPYMYHVGMDSHNCFPVAIEIIEKEIQDKVNECKAFL